MYPPPAEEEASQTALKTQAHGRRWGPTGDLTLARISHKNKHVTTLPGDAQGVDNSGILHMCWT